MDEKAFAKKYPNLSPTLMGEFDVSGLTDEEIAGEAIEFSGYSPDERAAAIRSLVQESHQLLLDLDREWTALRDVANRGFDSVDDARTWLLRVLAVWERGLRQLQGGKPS